MPKLAYDGGEINYEVMNCWKSLAGAMLPGARTWCLVGSRDQLVHPLGRNELPQRPKTTLQRTR